MAQGINISLNVNPRQIEPSNANTVHLAGLKSLSDFMKLGHYCPANAGTIFGNPNDFNELR